MLVKVVLYNFDIKDLSFFTKLYTLMVFRYSMDAENI